MKSIAPIIVGSLDLSPDFDADGAEDDASDVGVAIGGVANVSSVMAIEIWLDGVSTIFSPNFDAMEDSCSLKYV